MVGPAKAYRSVGAGSRASYSGDRHSARSRHSLSYVSSVCSAAESIQRFPDLIFTHNKLLQARSLTSPDAWVLPYRCIPRFHSTLNLDTFSSSSEMGRTPPINLSRSNVPLCPHPYPNSNQILLCPSFHGNSIGFFLQWLFPLFFYQEPTHHPY